MAEHRPFPPSPRRRALARRAGVLAASPHLVAAGAWIGVVVALVVVARGAAARIGAWIAAACGSADGSAPLAPTDVAGEIVSLALPVLAALAIAAFVAHVAQTRALWLPRRRLPGAPAAPGRRDWLGVVAASAFGAVAFGWLWQVAPRFATLASLDHALGPAAALLASFIATLALVWVATGAIDLLVRTADTTAAMHMTAAEKREDDRLAAADPRWRDQGRMRTSATEAMRGASLLLLGDGVAVAIAWDPIYRPIPTRVAAGRDARATQLLGLARRHAVPVHRDPALALALDGDGPVPERDWPRVAEVIAAVRGRAQV